MKLRRCDDTDTNAMRSGFRDIARQALEKARMYVLPLPQKSFGLHSFTDFAAGKTKEKQ